MRNKFQQPKRRVCSAIVLAAIVTSSAQYVAAQTAYFSIQGNFATAADKEDFGINLTRAVTNAETFKFQTFARAGGTNAAGDIIAANPSAIDSVLELFDGSNVSRGVNDDQNGSTNRDSLLSWSGIQTGGGTPLNPAPMPAGNYRLNQIAFNNSGTGPWAVDLIGPSDAMTFTSLTPTGTSTVSSIKIGSTGGGNATFSLSSALTITGGLTVAQTGFATMFVNTGATLTTGGVTNIKSGAGVLMSGGTWNANDDINITSSSFNFSGGTLNLASGKALTVSTFGQLTYSGSYDGGQGRTLNILNNGSANISGSLNIGSFIDTGSLLVSGTGSTLTTNTSTTGDASWGTLNGTANVTINSSGTATINAATLHLSDDGLPSSNSTVTISSGGKLITKNIRISGSSVGTSLMSISGTNSSFSQATGSSVVLGGSSTSSGTLTISSGGSFTAETGGMTVNGTGVVNNSATFTSKGTLTINSGGVFNQTGGTTNLNLGMNLAGGKYSHTAGNFNLAANQIVSITNGGLFEWTGGGTTLNITNPGTIYNVSGTGSILRQTHTSVGDTNIFIDGGAAINIGAGGKVEAEYISVGYGTVTVSGAGANLDVTHGSTAGFPNFIGTTGLSSVMITNGASASFKSITPSTLYLGFIGGTGILNVYSPNVGVQSLAIGTNGTGDGALNVASNLSQDGTSTLTIGQATGGGSGYLNVVDNAFFSSGTGSVTINPTGHVSVVDGAFIANNAVTINGGTITQTTSNGNVNFPQGFTASNNAQVQVYNHFITKTTNSTIQSGADVTIGSHLFWSVTGDISGLNNSMTVDGLGSSLSVQDPMYMAEIIGSSTLTVKNQATADLGDVNMANTGTNAVSTMNVQSGSFVTVKNLAMGTGSSGTTTGTLNIDNASFSQSGSSNLTLGTSVFGSVGTMNVTNGGVFTSGSGTLTINPTGTVNVSGNGLFTASAPLTVHGGAVNLTSGAVTLQQGFTADSAGQLHLADHDMNPGYNDSIATGADVFITGTLRFNNPSYPVRASNQFTIDGNGSSLTATATLINPLAGTLLPTPASSVMTVSNQATASLGQLTMSSTYSPTISSSTQLNVLSGAHVTANSLSMATGLVNNATAAITVSGSGSTFTHNSTSAVTIGAIGGATGSITIQSGGTFATSSSLLTINSGSSILNNSGTFNASSIFNRGTIESNSTSNVATVIGSGTLTVGGGNFNVSSRIQQTSLTIIGGGRVSIAANGSSSGVTDVGALTISSISKLELHNNDLVVRYDPQLVISPYNTIRSQVQSGLALLGGSGVGILSAEVDAQTISSTFLAVVDNGAIEGQIDFTSGYAVPDNSVIVKYTWFGDSNLDGAVNGADYALLDSGFTSGGSLGGWLFGDYDYNGAVDASDYALIDSGFIQQSGVLPEPAMLGLLGVSSVAFARRRRKFE